MEWKNIYRGLLMGISDLIPGVSGGTIAFLLGIYDRLLQSISQFFSRQWKRSLPFLIPLGIGLVGALLLFSRVINFLLENYEAPTMYFFLGLIIGVVPFIAKQAEVKTKFKFGHFILFVIVAALLATAAFIDTSKSVTTSLTLNNAVFLFLAGWVASMAMLLPGISGSFILLLMGAYHTATNALATLNFPVIVVIGSGVIVGFIISSKAISFILLHYRTLTFSIILGLIIGSVFVIYPGLPESGTPLVMSVVAFITGLIVANMFNEVGEMNSQKKE